MDKETSVMSNLGMIQYSITLSNRDNRYAYKIRIQIGQIAVLILKKPLRTNLYFLAYYSYQKIVLKIVILGLKHRIHAEGVTILSTY